MNETIGAKGGRNDRKRSLKIRKQQKAILIAEREAREIKNLEKKVKKQQLFTLIKVLPLVITGQTIKTIYNSSLKDTKEKKILEKDPKISSDKKLFIEESKEKKLQTREIIVSDKDNNKKKTTSLLIYLNDDYFPIKRENNNKEKKEDNEIEKERGYDAQDILITSIPKNDKKEENKEESKEEKSKDFSDEAEKNHSLDDENKVDILRQDYISLPTTRISYENSSILDKDNLEKNDIELDELKKIKSRKIIEEYEKQLKDMRYDLRNLIFDYNILVDNKKEVIFSEETLDILDKLSFIISKIEELKRKIEIEDLDKYDDNYLYSMIENYLTDFKDKKVVDEIKDSTLYILISEKLEELDLKKEKLQRDVESKKEKLEIKEEKFEMLKEMYFNIDKINNDLLKIQYEQEKILKEVQEKVKNAVSIQEKVEVQVEVMNRQSRKIFKMLRRQMLFPGLRSGRSMAATAAAYYYFLNQLLNPKTTTKKYKVINVKDYSVDIKNNIESLINAKDIMEKTVKQIDNIILEINDEFRDYLGVLNAADDLLANLKKIREELKEKEYEMNRMMEEQKLVLKKNNAKVLEKGKYPM